MQGMFKSIIHQLSGGKILNSMTIICNIGEGLIAKSIEEIERKYQDLKIGSYPYFKPNGFGTSIVLRSINKEILKSASKDVLKSIKNNGGEDPSLDDTLIYLMAMTLFQVFLY